MKLFLSAALLGSLSVIAVLLLEQYILARREPFDRRDCEEYLQTEYGSIIHEARRQVWVNDVEAMLEERKGKDE